MIVRLGALALASLLLMACEERRTSQPGQPSQGSISGEKYARDREFCRAQVDENMRTRRNVDDSRRDVLRGDDERWGRNQLPDQMAAYSDSRTFDKLMGSCMEGRGWPQPRQDWWQRFGTSHSI
jgi:hypothetical protein